MRAAQRKRPTDRPIHTISGKMRIKFVSFSVVTISPTFEQKDPVASSNTDPDPTVASSKIDPDPQDMIWKPARYYYIPPKSTSTCWLKERPGPSFFDHHVRGNRSNRVPTEGTKACSYQPKAWTSGTELCSHLLPMIRRGQLMEIFSGYRAYACSYREKGAQGQHSM